VTQLGRWLTTGAALIVAVFFAAPAVAQVDVHVSLSSDTVEVGEVVELTVVVTGAMLGVEAPRVPQIDYLRVVSTASQNNINFVNGRTERTTVFIYGLRASREGAYTIPPLVVPVGDATYNTRALALTVRPSTSTSPRPPDVAPPSSGQPDFGFPRQDDVAPGTPAREINAITEVDNRTPWAGEQITLTLKFLQAHTLRLMGNAEYEPPSSEGLIAEPLPDEPQHSAVIDGVTYEVATRKTALIAPAPGEYTIGPAKISFRRGFMTADEIITTEPITLNVRPLPSAGRPPDFSGAVGRIQLAMSLATNEVRVGEAASLRLEISGTGDLRQIEPPEVSVEGDASVYQSGEERQIAPRQTSDGYAIGGRVTFDYLIMPRSAGTLTLNPVVVHYFDPDAARYQSAMTSSATITVMPGEAGETTAEPGGAELRYIKENDLALISDAPITSRLWFWVLQAVPLLGLGWALRERAERLRRERDPRYRRRVEAARRAHRLLAAIDPADTPSEICRRADEALAEYIADRTGIAAAGVTPEAARELLVEAGATEDLAERARDLLRQLRAGAYAPGAAGALRHGESVEATRSLIAAIEEVLR
jgi:hypothetical protein